MAGYSGTPLAKKLGLEDGMRAYLVGVPDDLAPMFATLNVTPKLAPSIVKELDYIHVFSTDADAVAKTLPKLAKALADTGMLWLSWPKKASKRPTTLDETGARSLGLASGLVDVKVCAVDEVWSGLKFMRRLVDRAK